MDIMHNKFLFRLDKFVKNTFFLKQVGLTEAAAIKRNEMGQKWGEAVLASRFQTEGITWLSS